VVVDVHEEDARLAGVRIPEVVLGPVAFARTRRDVEHRPHERAVDPAAMLEVDDEAAEAFFDPVLRLSMFMARAR
jgi:hypothetical protein